MRKKSYGLQLNAQRHTIFGLQIREYQNANRREEIQEKGRS